LLQRVESKKPARQLSLSASSSFSIPAATYRLQFNAKFNFKDALDLVDYLRDLGISDCYASPVFAARSQSTHGYDVCNFHKMNPELGNANQFQEFARSLQHAEMGLLLDIVPNHMAADCANDWWCDVLEKGRESKYAHWFDINWDPPEPELKGKVLLPVLEDECEKLVENGKIQLVFENDAFSIKYHDRRFPLSPTSRLAVKQQVSKYGIPKVLQRYNGHIDVTAPSALQHLLETQNYRLGFWRLASEKLNYRRFFDVTELVCLRMEEPEVFKAAHTLVFSLIKAGKVTGLRVDHPDGLWNPRQYFERLQEGVRKLVGNGHAAGAEKRNLFCVVAEKILTGDEPLPEDWPVHGTTGYDFLNRLNGLFVDVEAEQDFQRLYTAFTGESEDFARAVLAGKRKILTTSLKSEVNQLARRLERLKEGQDFSFEEIREAVREVIVHFPVYRSYITEQSDRPAATEAAHINRAIAETLATHHGINGEVLRLLRSILLLRHPKAHTPRFRDFVMRFQQLTGPATAKGLEDTAFYNYNRLISLNEVGGDPGTFGISVEKFHEHNTHIAKNWPNTLLATATHDTKRGEDARARINVLSEFPSEWREALQRCSKLNADRKTDVDGQAAPSTNDEYLFYQTLIGAWPAQCSYPAVEELRDRMLAHMTKALREAKAHTNWLEPNAAYEEVVRKFVSATLDANLSSIFLNDFETFQKRIAFFGYWNSLSQVLLKLTSPGIPDLYQGCELWDFSLVDPDNRRPVDFDLRKQILQQVRSEVSDRIALIRKLLAQPETGAVKIYLLWRALTFRQAHRDLFQAGDYLPLQATGNKAEHVVAFARRFKNKFVIAVAPRLVAKLCNKEPTLPIGEAIWSDTALSLASVIRANRFQNILTGEAISVSNKQLPLSSVLVNFPVALLTAVTRPAR